MFLKKRFCKYGHDTSEVGRYHGGCKKCLRKVTKEWMKLNPKVLAEAILKRRCKLVGLTVEQFDALPKKCSFPQCDAVKPGGKGDWHLDHDHATGRFRGLLCYKHNRRVGDLSLEESRRVTEYLQRKRECLTRG